jgi:hypothetical protein
MTMANVEGQRHNGCGCETSGQPAFTRSLGLSDPPPLLTAAVDSCMEALGRLRDTVASADNPALRSRELVRRETGVDVDANPYHGLTREKIEAVVRAAFHARAMPEVLLAKWAKEGSTAMTRLPQTVTQATTAANAKTLLRSSIYYRQLGVDWLTVTHRPTAHSDNILDETDAGATAQERYFAARVAELVRERVLAEDITAAVNAQLAVTSSGGSFSVQPSVRFYGLSLLLVDAVFARFLAMSFPQLGGVTEELGYMLWNMGEASFRTFLESADAHRREPAFLTNGQPLSIERWALHTTPRSTEYAQARTNAIRFAHYLRCFRPIFQNALTLIKPGIEDLRGVSAHSAGFEEDPLGISAVPSASGVSATSRAMTGSVPGGGHGSFRHDPLGGAVGDNVELRWNVPADIAANSTIDIVVHLHGYGDPPSAHFLADKTTVAGVSMVDASGTANVRANRPTLVIVPRGRYTSGATWLFDNLSGAPAFRALVSASLAWLSSTPLRRATGSAFREGRCTIMAHSGGGAGLSALLAAGVDPDEVVCYDSMYGGEAAIRHWTLARLTASRAAESALRVFYRACGGPSAEHPAGEWRWNRRHARWEYNSPGSWSFRNGDWHLITTEVSARQLKHALDGAIAALPVAQRNRFRVERTTVEHNSIPARYSASLLDDIAATVPDAFAAPPSTVRPACCANDTWLSALPVKLGGGDPPPPQPTAPPPTAAPPTAQQVDEGEGNASGSHERSYAFSGSAARVIAVNGFAAIGATALEAPFTAPAKTWTEISVSSRAAFDAIVFDPIEEPSSYANFRDAGFARDSGSDGFEVRIKGRLVVPGGLARRSAPVPLVIICMGNHNTFDAHGEIPSFEGYDYLQQALAASGYASLSVDTNPANEINAGIRMRADLILATVRQLQDHGDAAVVSKIDFGNVAFVGHSRGGEAVVYAAKLNRVGSRPLGVRGVVSIAPTDISRGCAGGERIAVTPGTVAGGPPSVVGPAPLDVTVPFALTAADAIRYLVIYGSHDGDVSGDGDDITAPVAASSVRDGTGFSLYDRATAEKTMIFPRGITHNRFNTLWNNCADYGDPGHSFLAGDCSVRNPAERFNERIFAAAKHRELAIFYVTAFVDRVLKNDASKEDVLRGKRALPPHSIAFQFLPADRLDVSLTGASPPLQTFTLIHCPHDATVLQAPPGTRLRASLGHVDLLAQRRNALTMRVGAQYAVPDEATIAGERGPAFTVRIESRAGTSVATDRDLDRVGSLEPDKPFFHRVRTANRNVTKLQLDTVVLPLTAFRPPLEPTDIRSMEIEIGSGGTTPVFIDCVAFV